MYLWYYLQFFILTLKSSLAKIVNIYVSTRNLYILGKNTSIYCSRIIVVHVHTTVFSKVSKGAKIRNIYNEIPYLTQDTNGKVTNSQLD